MNSPTRFNKFGVIYDQGVALPKIEISQVAYFLRVGYSKEKIAIIVGHSLQAVSRIEKKLKKNENIFELVSKPCNSGFHTHPQNLSIIRSICTQYVMRDYRSIAKCYNSVFPENKISLSMLRYVMHQYLHITGKRISPIEIAREQPEIKDLYWHYVRDIMPILASRITHLIFIDETHVVSNDLIKKKRYVPNGMLPLAYNQNLYMKQSCSLIMAICWDGIVHFQIEPHGHDSGVKSLKFAKFLSDMYCNVGTNAILVMDNAKTHKSTEVKFVLDNGYVAAGVPVFHQAKFSPELNPIERVFGFFKRMLKNQNTTNIYTAIYKTCHKIPAHYCRNCIKQVFRELGILADQFA